MKLSQHEQKILDIVSNHPEILDDPEKRESIAKLYGLTEKTLRNRIAELKKYGYLHQDGVIKDKIQKTPIIENGEIDFGLIWETIRKNKLFISKITLLFFITGIIYSFTADIYYRSSISLYPAGELGGNGGMLGDFQGVAQSFGISGFGPTPTYNIPDIVNSRRLKKAIVLNQWNSNSNTEEINLIQYWEIDKPKWLEPKKWISNLFPVKKFKPKKNDVYVEKAMENLNKLISVKEEISGLITVSILMQDPNLAAEVTNYIAEYVKKFISFEQKREATKNREFVEQQKLNAKKQLENSEEKYVEFKEKYPQTVTPELMMTDIRLRSAIEENRAVYITLRQQFEISKIEEVKDKLLVNILDIAEPAVEKSKPKRTFIILFMIFIGCLSSISFLLLKELGNT